MKKSMLTKLFALVLMIGVVFSLAIIVSSAETATATITFDDTSKRTVGTTSQQVWVENGITFTNDKASSSTNVNTSFYDPVRCYAKSSITIYCSLGNITTITMVVPSGASDLVTSVGAEASASGTTVTIVPTATSDTYSVASLTKQIRFTSITVTYETSSSCEHANTTITTVEATKGEEGSITTTCTDCGEVVSTETIPALGYEIAFVVPDGAEAPTAEDALSVVMPEFTVPDGTYAKDYTFVGWATQTVSSTSDRPTIHAAGTEVDLTEDTTFYAVYTYIDESGEGSTTSEYNLGTATDGATVVITMTTANGTVYALSSANGTTSAPEATVVTVSGGKITSEVKDVLKWDVSQNGDSYVFYVSGSTETWLYCTSTNSGVRVGTNTANAFTIDATSGYLKHTGTGRYVGVYTTTPDWRCYTNTTGNTANQTLGFYVLTQSSGTTYYTSSLETSSCDHSDAEVVTENPTCEVAGSVTTTCSCGYTSTEVIAALGHNYDDGVVTADPTCTATGVKTYTCQNDNSHTYTEDIPMIGHSYTDGVCTECGEAEPAAPETPGSSNRYYIATIRSSGNYFYMTSDLGTASTKRYTAVDSGLTALPESITSPEAGYVFILIDNGDGTYSLQAEGVDGDNYLGWTSGNSGTLVAEASAVKFTLDENEGVYNIHFTASDAERYLALNGNSGYNYFAWYKSGQKQDLTLIPVVEAASDCEHTNKVAIGEAKDATCTEDGITAGEKCADCDYVIAEQEVITATGHSYTDGTCTKCGEAEPDAPDYSGLYYIATIRSSGNYWYMTNDLGTANTKRYTAVDSGLTELSASITEYEYNKVFKVVKNDDGTYSICAMSIAGERWLGWTSGNSGTLVAKANAIKFTVECSEGTYQFHFTADEERYLSLNNTSGSDYFAFYKGTQKQDLTLIPVENYTTIKSVSVRLGTDLALLFNVSAPGASLSMTFEFDGEIFTVTEYTVNSDGTYTFVFEGIGPHQMANVITAILKDGETVVDSLEDYSVNTNLNNIRENATTEVKAVIDATLAYGVKSNAYLAKTEDTTIDLSGINVEATVKTPATTDASKAYFKSAGVYFDVNNKIFVKFFAVEGFSIKIGDVDVTENCEALGNNEYKLYTDAITATQFDKDYVFTIIVEETEIATLTYSVNSYAAAMQVEGIPVYVADLAKALYAYGVAAKNCPTEA